MRETWGSIPGPVKLDSVTTNGSPPLRRFFGAVKPEPAAEQSTWGAKRLSGGAKFEIKHKSHCYQKSKLVNWGVKHVDWGDRPPLAPALGVAEALSRGDGPRHSSRASA